MARNDDPPRCRLSWLRHRSDTTSATWTKASCSVRERSLNHDHPQRNSCRDSTTAVDRSVAQRLETAHDLSTNLQDDSRTARCCDYYNRTRLRDSFINIDTFSKSVHTCIIVISIIIQTLIRRTLSTTLDDIPTYLFLFYVVVVNYIPFT